MTTQEISSLIQHVQLNEVGWYKNGIKSIIKSLYGKSNNTPLNYDELYQSVSMNLNIKFLSSDFKIAFDNLVSKKELVKVEKGFFKLSDEEYNKFEDVYKRYIFIEEETIRHFNTLLITHLPEDFIADIDIKAFWDDFINLLIVPLIIKSGAKTYEIITGNSTSDITYENNKEFFHKYMSIKEPLSKIILNFFTSPNSSVKDYIFNLLKTYFFIEATKLPENSIEKIYKLSSSQSELRIFIDTNFLLSLLDLHDNPLNKAAYALTELLNEVKNKINVKFLIYRHTIGEFQNLINKYKTYLIKNPLLLGHAKTLIDVDDVSGIPKRYYQKCVDAGEMLDVSNYFEPFLNNFTVTLRKKKIELHNENIDKFLPVNNISVNDDIIDQVSFRFENFKKSLVTQKKGQELELYLNEVEKRIERKFKHDCILWHSVKDKRPIYIDSVKDVKHWILTLDFQFLSFDRYKTNTSERKISLCLHPNDLISLLYFWVPRTDKFVNAIFENFRLPFSFSDFDENAEKVSLSILSALSQYENSTDIDKETTIEILTNKILRNKIKPELSIEKNAELIKEEIFIKYKENKVKLEKQKNENIDLKTRIDSIEKNIVELNNTFSELITKSLNQEKLKAVQSVKHNIELLSKDKDNYSNQLEDLLPLKRRADEEYERNKKKFLNYLFKRDKAIRNKIFSRYPSFNKIPEYEIKIEEINNKLTSLKIEIPENIVFYCENKNASDFEKLGFEKISFFGLDGSSSVFVKIATNPVYFGLRDGDFLTDNEISKIKNKYPNYKILHYYCFEKFLYHPDNIDELNIDKFDKQEYINDILLQLEKRIDKIILNIKSIRKGYYELKNTESGINPEKDAENLIIKSLKSKDIENVLKYFSLKKGSYDKSYLNQFSISKNDLLTTNWFKQQIKIVMEI